MAEPVESLFERRRSGDVELICLLCGRGSGPEQEQAARLACSVAGCLKARVVTGGSDLCANHRAVATRRERRVG